MLSYKAFKGVESLLDRVEVWGIGRKHKDSDAVRIGESLKFLSLQNQYHPSGVDSLGAPYLPIMTTSVVANQEALRQWPWVHPRQRNKGFESLSRIRALKHVDGDIALHR
jgi:hypothetical protein